MLTDRPCSAVLGVWLGLGSPWLVAEARAAEAEVLLDVAAKAFEGPLVYSEKIKVVTLLPAGSQAVLEYWPRRRSEGCDAARTAIMSSKREADREFLVRRPGVPSGDTADKPTKYTFQVDRLLIGLPYCFRLESTEFRRLTATEQNSLQKALDAAFERVLVGRMRPEQYETCSKRDMLHTVSEPGIIKACMLAEELVAADAALAELQVRTSARGSPTPLKTLIAESLREDDAILAEFKRRTAASDNVAINETWASDSKEFITQAAKLRAGHPARSAFERVVKALLKPAAGRVQELQSEYKAHCEPPDEETKRSCAYLGALRHASEAEVELTESKQMPKFAAFTAALGRVERVSEVNLGVNIAEPTFKDRIPFYVSLDVGGAAVPFRAGTWGIAQYFGVNFYLIPVDRDEPLRWTATRHRGREFFRRFSLSLGITTTGAAFREEDGVTGAIGKQFLLFGGGFRITNLLRAGLGVTLYRQSSQNPAGGETKFRGALFFGLSMDIDVFSTIKKSIGGS